MSQLITALTITSQPILAAGISETISIDEMRVIATDLPGRIKAQLIEPYSGVGAEIWNNTPIPANGVLKNYAMNLVPGSVIAANRIDAEGSLLRLIFDIADDGSSYALACGGISNGVATGTFVKYFFSKGFAKLVSLTFINSNFRHQIAATGNFNLGLFAGGLSSSGLVGFVDIFNYIVDTVSAGAALNTTVVLGAVFGTFTHAIIAGGAFNDASTVNTKKYGFNTQITTNGGALAVQRTEASGANNKKVGIVYGGRNSGSNPIGTHEIYTFSTDTSSGSAVASAARSKGAATGSSTLALILGGLAGSTLIGTSVKYTYSTDLAVIESNLSPKMQSMAATSDRYTALFLGGRVVDSDFVQATSPIATEIDFATFTPKSNAYLADAGEYSASGGVTSTCPNYLR